MLGAALWRQALTYHRNLAKVTISLPSGTDSSVVKSNVPIQKSDPRTIARRPEVESRQKWMERELARLLASSKLKKAQFGNMNYLHMYFREDPWFRKLVEETKSELGAEFVPVLKSLLAATQGADTHCLLLLMLGMAQEDAAIPILQQVIATKAGSIEFASALFSLGLMKKGESYQFLTGYYQSFWGANPELQDFNTQQDIVTAIAMHGDRAIPFVSNLGLAFYGKIPLPQVNDLAGWMNALSGRWLYHLDASSPTDAIRICLESNTDPRLKSTLVGALIESKTPESMAFAKDLYSKTNDPYVRCGVLQALILESSKWGPDWFSRLGDPSIVDSILRTTPPAGPFSPEIALCAALALRSNNSSVSEEWIRALLKGDLANQFGDRAGQVLISISSNIAETGKYGSLISEMVAEKSTLAEKGKLLSTVYRNQFAKLDNPDHFTLLVEALNQSKPNTPEYGFILDALSHTQIDKGKAIELCAQGLSGASPDFQVWIMRDLAKLGGDAVPYIESILQSKGSLIVRLEAAMSYLTLTQPEDQKPKEVLLSSISDLVAPGKDLPVDMVYGEHISPAVYAQVVKEYYTRYGTVESIPLLDAIPSMISGGKHIPEEWMDGLRAQLLNACSSAKDYILLKSASK